MAVIHNVITTAYHPQNNNIVLFDKITMHINDILSDHSSASVDICGDFNIHHKQWLVQLNKKQRKKKGATVMAFPYRLRNNPYRHSDLNWGS